MKMRKLDQILEQCLEDMSINESKFNFDKFNKLCEDVYDLDDPDKEEALEVLGRYEEDILDKKDLTTEKEEAAENAGYKLYDNSLVIDVKGRPYIDNEQVSNYLNSPEGEDHYQLAIQDFINALSNEIPDFVTEGRMNGYWGIADFDLEIANYDELAEALLNKAKQDPDYEQIKELGNLNGHLEDILYSNLEEFAELAELKIANEDLTTMKELSDLIDKQEAEMNKPEFWNI